MDTVEKEMARRSSRARRSRITHSHRGGVRTGGGRGNAIITPVSRQDFLSPTQFNPLSMTFGNVYFCHYCLENHFVDARNKTMAIKLSCGHIACIGELQKYVKHYLSRNVGMIPCICTIDNPSEKEDNLLKRKVCNALFTVDDVSLILKNPWSPIKDEEATTQFEAIRFQLANPFPRPCPTCQTPHIANPSDPSMQCSNCNTSFCFTHGNEHPGSTCAEAYFRAFYQDYTEKALNSQLTRKCTRKECRAPTLKSESNFMTCIKCGQNWCWRCQKSLEEDIGAERHFRILSPFSPCATRLIDDPRRNKLSWKIALGIFHFLYVVFAYLPAFAFVSAFFLCFFFICIPVGLKSRRGCWRFFDTQVYYISLGIGGVVGMYGFYPILVVCVLVFGLATAIAVCMVKAAGLKGNGNQDPGREIPFMEDVKSQRALNVILTSSYGNAMGISVVAAPGSMAAASMVPPAMNMNGIAMMYPGASNIPMMPPAGGVTGAQAAQLAALYQYATAASADGQKVMGQHILQYPGGLPSNGMVVGSNPIFPAAHPGVYPAPTANTMTYQPNYGTIVGGEVMYPPQGTHASPHPPSTFAYDDVQKPGSSAAVAPAPMPAPVSAPDVIRAFNPVYVQGDADVNDPGNLDDDDYPKKK